MLIVMDNKATQEEIEAHDAMIEKLGEKAIWGRFLS